MLGPNSLLRFWVGYSLFIKSIPIIDTTLSEVYCKPKKKKLLSSIQSKRSILLIVHEIQDRGIHPLAPTDGDPRTRISCHCPMRPPGKSIYLVTKRVHITQTTVTSINRDPPDTRNQPTMMSGSGHTYHERRCGLQRFLAATHGAPCMPSCLRNGKTTSCGRHG